LSKRTPSSKTTNTYPEEEFTFELFTGFDLIVLVEEPCVDRVAFEDAR
jgi:hypothetical protein